MTKRFMLLLLIVLWAGSAFAQVSGAAPSQSIRPIGVVTRIQAGSLILHTDAGADLLIALPVGVSFLRVPPGATNLSSAAHISVADVSVGDRVLVRGQVSGDLKSFVATSVILMTKSDLAGAREGERLDWQRRGMSGTVQAVNLETKEITVTVPTAPGNPTHSMTAALGPDAVLLRYAPDSVKFSDAKPSNFEQIKVGDQIRALGITSQAGDRFTVEKLVSGTFRSLGVTVVSVDAQGGAIVAKDLASGQPVLVRTNADSKLRRLSPALAHTLAIINSGETKGKAEDTPSESLDVQKLLAQAAALDLSELKSGDLLIVMSTEGTKPTEVTAIDILAGVEPILAARSKGTNQAVLGSWSLRMNGGDSGP